MKFNCFWSFLFDYAANNTRWIHFESFWMFSGIMKKFTKVSYLFWFLQVICHLVKSNFLKNDFWCFKQNHQKGSISNHIQIFSNWKLSKLFQTRSVPHRSASNKAIMLTIFDLFPDWILWSRLTPCHNNKLSCANFHQTWTRRQKSMIIFISRSFQLNLQKQKKRINVNCC